MGFQSICSAFWDGYFFHTYYNHTVMMCLCPFLVFLFFFTFYFTIKSNLIMVIILLVADWLGSRHLYMFFLKTRSKFTYRTGALKKVGSHCCAPLSSVCSRNLFLCLYPVDVFDITSEIFKLCLSHSFSEFKSEILRLCVSPPLEEFNK